MVPAVWWWTGDDEPPPAIDPDAVVGAVELADAVRDHLTLTGTLRHLAELAAGGVGGSEGAGVTVVLGDAPALVAGSASFVEDVDALQQGLGEGPVVTAVAEGCTVVVGSGGTDRRWPAFAADAARLGVGSAVAVPLLVGGAVRGCLSVYARAEHVFGPVAIAAAERYAPPLALAVAEAQLLSSTRTLAQEVHDVLSARAIVDVALGVLVHRNGIDEDEAAAHLHDIARVHQRSVLAVARSILADAAVWHVHSADPVERSGDDQTDDDVAAEPRPRSPAPVCTDVA